MGDWWVTQNLLCVQQRLYIYVWISTECSLFSIFIFSITSISHGNSDSEPKISRNQARLRVLSIWSSLFLSQIASPHHHRRKLIEAAAAGKVNSEFSASFLFLLTYPLLSFVLIIYLCFNLCSAMFFHLSEDQLLIAFCAYLQKQEETLVKIFKSSLIKNWKSPQIASTHQTRLVKEALVLSTRLSLHLQIIGI